MTNTYQEPQGDDWLVNLRSQQKAAIAEGQGYAMNVSWPYMKQLGKETSLDTLKSMFLSSQKDQSRAPNCPRPYSETTKDLLFAFVIQAGQTFGLEDALIQRIVMVFDFHISTVLDAGEANDEMLSYHLFACFYLCLKVENRHMNDRGQELSYSQFVQYIVQLPTYVTLERHLVENPDDCPLQWQGTPPELYSNLEKVILEDSLRFRTFLISPAEVVHQMVVTFAFQQEITLEEVLSESLFRSYLCMQDYKPADHTSWDLGVASIQSALEALQAPKIGAQFQDFIQQITVDQQIVRVSSSQINQSLQKHIQERVASIDETVTAAKAENKLNDWEDVSPRLQFDPSFDQDFDMDGEPDLCGALTSLSSPTDYQNLDAGKKPVLENDILTTEILEKENNSSALNKQKTKPRTLLIAKKSSSNLIGKPWKNQSRLQAKTKFTKRRAETCSSIPLEPRLSTQESQEMTAEGCDLLCEESDIF